MATEVGSAYFTLLPSVKGIQGAISKELGGIGAEGGRASSKGFISGMGGALGSVVKIGAGAVAAVGGLLGGIALQGGVARALNIEDAQAKLKGLGHDVGSVDTIMQDAMASVKGTAFGLGDAATIAANAVAAGIKPGADLQRTLSLTGDAATIAGTSLGEMGSIFGKVAASGTIMGEEIAQLQDRGIPILQLLGDELGVSAGEVKKLASEGKVSFEDFQNAIENGMGGAALAGGETFRGAMANARAALARIGETVAVPVLGLIKDAFNAFIPVADSVNAALKPMVATLQETWGPKISGAIQGFGTAAAGLPGIFERIGGAVQTVRDFIAPVESGFNTLATAAAGLGLGALGPLMTNLPLIGGMFTGITGPIGLVVGAIVGLITQSAPLREVLGTGFQTIITAIVEGATQLAPMLQLVAAQIMGLVGNLGNALAPVVAAVMDIIAQLIPIIFEVAGMLLPMLSQAFAAVAPVISMLGPVLGTLVSTIGAILIPIIQALLPVVQAVFSAIVPIISAALQIVQGIIMVVTGIITGNWSSVWSGIQTILSGVWAAIKAVVTGAIGIIAAVIQSGLSIISSVWSMVWNNAGSLLRGIWDGITGAIRNGVSNVVNTVSNIKGSILGAVAGAGQWLYSAGVNVVQGLINGVRSLAGSIGNFFLDMLPGWIVGPFKAALGIASPSKLFFGFGRNIGEGTLLGVESMKSDIASEMADLVAVPALPTVADLRSTRAYRATVDYDGNSESDTLIIEGNVYGDPEDIVKEVNREKKKATTLNGLRKITAGG